MTDTRHKDYGMSERAWNAYIDQSRSTYDAVAEVIRISVAEELRRLGDVELASVHIAASIMLHARAAELDPDGAQ